MVKRVYVDNSVIGGKCDMEFKEPTEKLFHEFILHKHVVLFIFMSLLRSLNDVGVFLSTNISSLWDSALIC